MQVSQNKHIGFGFKRIVFPTKFLSRNFKAGIKEMDKFQTHDEKAEHSEKFLRKIYFKIRNVWCEFYEDRLTTNQVPLFNDFMHEFGNTFETYLEANVWSRRRLDPYKRKLLPQNIKENCQNFADYVIESSKRYQMFFDKGLNSSLKFRSVFDTALEPAMQQAKEKNIKISLKGAYLTRHPDIEKSLAEDYRYYIVFSNLLSNAVKYTPENGMIKIKFSKGEKSLTQRKINFSIEDNGIGIPPDEHRKIFMGERGSNAIKSGIHGTGYGLERTRKIVREIGKFEIKSPVDPDSVDRPGTLFSFPIAKILKREDYAN